MPKVLLTSVCRPLGPKHGAELKKGCDYVGTSFLLAVFHQYKDNLF